MRLGICLLLLAVTAKGLSVCLLYSAKTPFDALQVVSLLGDFSSFVTFVSTREQIAAVQAEVVLDYVYEEGLSGIVRSCVEEGNYWKMWGEESSKQYGVAFSGYLKAMNLSRLLIIGDVEHANQVEALYDEDPFLYRDFAILPHSLNIDFAQQFVGRHIKSRGTNLLALFLSPQAAFVFLQALQAKKLDRAGYVYVLSQGAGRYRYLSNSTSGLMGNGVLIVGADTEVEPSLERLEARRIRELLNSIVQRNYLQTRWSLFYTRANTPIKAASTPSEITSTTLILFPGNTTVFPLHAQAQIQTSVNYKVTNPDGSQYPIGAQVMRGFKIAFEEVNNRTDILPYYHLEDRTVDLSGVRFNFNISLARVKTVQSSLGLIHMPFPVSEIIMGMTKVFTSLNISIPMTTGSGDSKLSDPKAYPLYVRARPSSKYICVVMARMIKYFGWSKVAFLYAADGSDMSDSYKSFLAVKDLFGINITNPESTRALPVALDNSTAGALNASLQAIIDSDTRIIIISHNFLFVIMEQLYDLGVREGYVQLYTSTLSDAIFKDEKFYKRRVVSKGAMLFFPRVFVGKVGETVKQQLIKRDGQGMFPNTCLFYDSAMLYLYATDYLVDRGYDYEDPYQIVHAMRDTHFHGCGGFITIEKGTNDRSAAEIVIKNVQYDSELDTAELKEVGSFNPFSTQPYQFTFPIQWPDDQPTYADSKPSYLDCPFLKELVREMTQGKMIGLVVDFAVAAVTLLVTVWIWRKWWNVKMPLLTQKEPIMVEDVLVLSTVVFDFFQFAAVGPELANLSHLVMSLSEGTGYDMQKFINITNGIYWVILDGVLVLVGVWTLICVLKFTRLDERISKLCSAYEYWSNLLMPTLGHLLFLPIVSTLTNVYLCYKGTSDSLTDSFLNKDCYEYCWRDGHLGYAIGSGLALLCYIPLGVFTRPLWQELQHNVHVKAQPLALMAKSVVQVLLIVLSNTLKQEDSSLHAYLYFAVISIYSLSMFISRQFNYDRLNLWQVLMMLSLLSLTISAYLSTQFPAVFFINALAVEYSLLACFGLCVQFFIPRFGSKLTRARSRDVRGLFQFAFTFGHRAQEGLEQFWQDNQLTGVKKSVENTKKE